MSTDARGLIQPEVETVLGLVLPLLGPLSGFVYSVASLTPGVESKLATAAGHIMTVAEPLMGPVGGLLSHGGRTTY